MAFAQLTHRQSLRDIESCLRAVVSKLHDLGIRGSVARPTLAEANEQHDWRVYADLAQVLIAMTRPLYAHDPFGAELDDGSTLRCHNHRCVALVVSLGAVSALARRGQDAYAVGPAWHIPTFMAITNGRSNDVAILDQLIYQPGALSVMDRGYLHFQRLFELHQTGAFFVTRAEKKTCLRRVYSHSMERQTGLRMEQTIRLTGNTSRYTYPEAVRSVSYFHEASAKRFRFLTNNLRLPALTVAHLYQARWNIEVFFKQIKQHLRIKSFYGNSENAIKTQIWVAACVYLLVALAKKKRGVDATHYTILQVLGVTVFEKSPILQVFDHALSHSIENLFD